MSSSNHFHMPMLETESFIRGDVAGEDSVDIDCVQATPWRSVLMPAPFGDMRVSNKAHGIANCNSNSRGRELSLSARNSRAKTIL
jgi:hypothetical protein